MPSRSRPSRCASDGADDFVIDDTGDAVLRLADADSLAPTLTADDYVRLAHFRYMLRVFSRQTELAARRAGLTPQQYFLLLAIRGFPGQDAPNISDLAERLQIRHNATIGLVNRAVERGLVEREQDPTGDDKRIVRVRLTDSGAHRLDALATSLHAERLRLMQAIEALGPE
ncbi:MAG TPA: MarR family transcriptional regulator [Ktedonobacterales bacterium]|nr:MarR family transcriptional regulator [Ktedonobacterales bacterium]